MRTLADLWPAVVGMALVTYVTRVGGLWIVGAARQTPRLERLLSHLATGVLTALVVSELRHADGAVGTAAVVAVAVMATSRNMLAAIGAGAVAAALVRMI